MCRSNDFCSLFFFKAQPVFTVNFVDCLKMTKDLAIKFFTFFVEFDSIPVLLYKFFA